MSAPFLITGAGTYADVYPRREIRDLQHDHHEQFTLFILAWEKIMDPKFRPTAAQFEQIGGIHGMPYRPWPGDPDEEAKTVRGAWLGYCNHASILFPNWHRPYVMLLEQVICDVAQGIAGKYACDPKVPAEQAAKWRKAARELRFPYWDWTSPETGKKGLPEIFKQENVRLLKPEGGQTYYHHNVLAYYKFNQPIDGFNNRLERVEIQGPHPPPDEMAYFKEWDRTYRRPNSKPEAVTEDYKALDADLTNPSEKEKGSWANLTSGVASTFSLPIDISPELWANVWDAFSNTTFQSSRPDKDGNPHSPFVWNIGFDPIFFLHHCNVDRLLSFWEHIYPDYTAGTEGYLDVDGLTRVPFTQSGGTFIETSNQAVDSKSPLMPFRKSDYTYWDADDTHSLGFVDPNSDPDNANIVRNKYYTYLPIGPVDPNPAVPPTREEREMQRRYLQDHFGYNPIKARDSRPEVQLPLFFPDGIPPHGVPGTIYSGVPRGLELPSGHAKVDNYRQFVVAASLSPAYHGGSYSLDIVLKVDEQSSVTIGSISVLGRGKSANCGNCQARRAANTRVRGIVLVPHDVIADILTAAPILAPTPAAVSSASERDDPAGRLIETLHTSLSSHVVLPSGKRHSELSRGHHVPVNRRLPDETSPTIRLLSCDVYQPDLGEREGQPIDAPFNFHGWLDHGPVLGTWTKA
ncbi:hypothetical protein FRC06_003964 [Ceratobasidium sp. 370]|nr:hypothetical protein FRC06_003964 [Ceratobasidium sp. 370]